MASNTSLRQFSKRECIPLSCQPDSRFQDFIQPNVTEPSGTTTSFNNNSNFGWRALSSNSLLNNFVPANFDCIAQSNPEEDDWAELFVSINSIVFSGYGVDNGQNFNNNYGNCQSFKRRKIVGRARGDVMATPSISISINRYSVNYRIRNSKANCKAKPKQSVKRNAMGSNIVWNYQGQVTSNAAAIPSLFLPAEHFSTGGEINGLI